MIISMKYEELLEQLKQYEIITFDIFDTLISRTVTHPTDVFRLVEKRWQKNNSSNIRFYDSRIQAEQTAYQKYGVCANLDQIYALLESDYGFSAVDVEQLKKLEIQTELDVVIPRRTMLKLYEQLQACGKTIILCSDMYLSASTIALLLEKAGYPEELSICVSSEQKVSKSDGSFWNIFFQEHAHQTTIHVGDNEWSDYRQVLNFGRDAILIDNPYHAFSKSPMYPYLMEYEKGAVTNSLVLGYFINQACFNSPFEQELDFRETLAIWMGPAFSCFMDWLSAEQDDSLLLFVTREGYILQPMYDAYCQASGKTVQDNTIFFASRSAVTAAAVTDAKLLSEIMQIEFEGTVAEFTASRLNYVFSSDREIGSIVIKLPKQKEYLLELLENDYEAIFENAKKQKLAYETYVQAVRKKSPDKKLTIVDVGYSGTTQYYLSKILNENISGKYLFLNRNPLPEKNNCICQSVAKTVEENHAIFENLLFLEAAMQVSHGQLQRLQICRDGTVKPVCKPDAQTSETILEAQAAFFEYVVWSGQWQKKLGGKATFDFALAETIWICMLKFSYLPKVFLENLWLSDDFAGNPLWTYDSRNQQWISGEKQIPIVFTIVPGTERVRFKYRMKLLVKRYIPTPFYELARQIWIRFIK